MASLEFYNTNINILKLYRASTEAKHLFNERCRSLKAERPWTSKNPASLQDLVLEVIANNFSTVFAAWFSSEIFSDIHRQKLIHILPTNLPLQVTSTTIPDGSFWKRSCYDHWNAGDFVSQYRDSWKSLFMEIFLQTYIENAYPNNINLIELKEIIDLVKEYVHVLHIEQLQAVEMPGYAECCIKHVDLRPILLSLSNLRELSIRVRVTDVSLKFATHLSQLTTVDCSNISSGLEKSCYLTSFIIHQTPLDKQKLRTICSSLASLPLLEHVEFSSCCISDDSLTVLAESVRSYPSVKRLILTNNKIGSDGSASLASVLPQIGLHTLSLRLNFVGDIGARELFQSLLTHTTLTKLILSGCKITSNSIQDLIALILMNRQLREIDLNCNDLKELANSTIIEALQKNPILVKLHLKMSGVPTQQIELIDNELIFNSKS